MTAGPKCPTCQALILDLKLIVHAYVIDGVRYRMGSAWSFQCGHLIWDDLCDWQSEDGLSRVVEKSTGRVLLEFREGEKALPRAPEGHPDNLWA